MQHSHPDKRAYQAKFLYRLSKEERGEYATIFRIRNAAYRYHQQASQPRPSLEGYHHWLQGLLVPIKNSLI
jgi:hypothetical protein